MSNNEVLERLHRIYAIYAAVNAVEEGDLGKFAPMIFQDEHHIAIYQNFVGGLTPAELSNLAHSVIHNLANLHDHLRRWARNNGHDPQRIEDAISNSASLQIIIDLSNNDKHGYPPWKGGRSGKAPKLVDVTRDLRLTTAPEAGSYVVVTLTPSGLKQVSGTGSTSVIIIGQVVDSNGAVIGDLYQIELEALGAWEEVLNRLGILT